KGRGEFITLPRCHAPRRRGIQYAAAFEMSNRRLGVPDHAPSRVMTERVCANVVPSRHRKSQRLAAATHVDRRKADRRKTARAAIALFGDFELALARAELL